MGVLCLPRVPNHASEPSNDKPTFDGYLLRKGKVAMANGWGGKSQMQAGLQMADQCGN